MHGIGGKSHTQYGQQGEYEWRAEAMDKAQSRCGDTEEVGKPNHFIHRVTLLFQVSFAASTKLRSVCTTNSRSISRTMKTSLVSRLASGQLSSVARGESICCTPCTIYGLSSPSALMIPLSRNRRSPRSVHNICNAVVSPCNGTG